MERGQSVIDCQQFEFRFNADLGSCDHNSGFISQACVPAGYICDECGHLIWQSVPQPPEVLGYLTATWEWKQSGKAFTTL